MTTLAEKSLYERLGGHAAIARIIEDLYERMLRDYRVWYYWKGHSDERKGAERGFFIDLVCGSARGLGASHDGDLQPAHAPLGLSGVEWWVFVELAAQALDQSSLNEREKEELFSLLARSKTAITNTNQAPSAVGAFAAYPQELTQREREVLRLVALGMNNSEISAELFISINTVTRHLTNIFVKTSTNNRVQAAVYAARRRIV